MITKLQRSSEILNVPFIHCFFVSFSQLLKEVSNYYIQKVLTKSKILTVYRVIFNPIFVICPNSKKAFSTTCSLAFSSMTMIFTKFLGE